MPLLKRSIGETPAVVYGKAGMVAKFDSNGLAEVDDNTANFFAKIRGYEVVADTQKKEELDSAEVPDTPKNEEFDFENFKAQTWHKQRTMLQNGEVPVAYLEQIAEGEFTDSVRASAKQQLGE